MEIRYLILGYLNSQHQAVFNFKTLHHETSRTKVFFKKFLRIRYQITRSADKSLQQLKTTLVPFKHFRLHDHQKK